MRFTSFVTWKRGGSNVAAYDVTVEQMVDNVVRTTLCSTDDRICARAGRARRGVLFAPCRRCRPDAERPMGMPRDASSSASSSLRFGDASALRRALRRDHSVARLARMRIAAPMIVPLVFMACSGNPSTPDQPPTPSPAVAEADLAPAPKPTADHGAEAKRLLAAAITSCKPDYITPIGPDPSNPCAAGDEAIAFTHWGDPTAEAAAFEALAASDASSRMWAAHLLNFKASHYRTDQPRAAQLVAAAEKEADFNVAVVIGNAVGRIDLTKTGLADRVEAMLRKTDTGGARLGLLSTILTANDARFRPVVQELVDDPDIGDHAKTVLE